MKQEGQEERDAFRTMNKLVSKTAPYRQRSGDSHRQHISARHLAARLLAWLSACLGWLAVIPASGYVMQRDAGGRPLHVDFTITPTLTYHLGTTGSVRGVLSNEWTNVRAAAGQWQAVPGTRIKFQEGAPIAGVAQIPAVDGRVDILWASPGTYALGPDFGGASISLSASGQVAVTYLFTDAFATDVILQAIILIRRDLDYTTSYTEFSANRPFLETVMLHELGHVLGANHSPLGTSTLWWYSGGGVNAATGLSADEVAFAQNVYGTTTTRAALGKVAGGVRLNGAGVLGALVQAERTNGILVSATVSRANGSYELPGLAPGTYRLRVSPLDPNAGSDAFLVRGADLDVTTTSEYALANTGFQPPSAGSTLISLNANSTQTVDFTVATAPIPPLRITEIRQGLKRSDRAAGDLALQLAPGTNEAWVGVYIPGPTPTNASLRLSGDGVTYGATEIIPGALRQLTLIQVPVSVSPTAANGPRTLELTADGKTARAPGFLEIPPTTPDDNFDGVSDLFQRAYWSPFTQALAAPELDPDGDGYSNLREALVGTNPLDANSFQFTLEFGQTNTGVIVTALVGVGKSYQLFVRDSFRLSWAPLGAPRVAITKLLEWTDERPRNSERYYQVRRLP